MGNSAHCGPRSYTVSPNVAYLTLVGTTLTLQTANPADTGTLSITLETSLPNFPSVASLKTTF